MHLFFKIIFSLVTILILIVIGYFSISAYIAYKLTIPNESPITFDRDRIGRGTDVTFRSKDNLQLAGWYFPGYNDKAIIFVHGAGNQNRANEVYKAYEIAKYFLDKDYTILMFDLRGAGESAKTRISFGQYEKNDVIGAFEYLKTQEFEPKNIGIISDSLGAITTIMAADEINSAGAIVLDSPASEVKSVVSHIMSKEHNIPNILHSGIYFMAKTIYKIDVDEVVPVNKIEAFKNTPLLFLHGEKDDLIPPYHSEILLSKVNKGERIIFPDTKHVETYLTHPNLYLNSVDTFFKKNL